MTLTRHLHPEAASELLEAAAWYEAERAGLGGDFLAEVGVTERRGLDWPEAAPAFPRWDDLPGYEAPACAYSRIAWSITSLTPVG